MYLLMGLANVMLGLLVQDRQPIRGFTRKTTFNVRPIRKDSVLIPTSGMKLALKVYSWTANGAARGCRQQDISPSQYTLMPIQNSKGPVSVGIRAPFGHDLSQQQRLLAVSAVELDRTILSEPGHVRIAWRVTVAKPPHLKQTQKSTCKDAFRHIS